MKKRANILALAAMSMVFGGVALAQETYATDSWGPVDRATFTWDSPASYRTINSITDNPLIGDERNFLRVRKAGTEDDFVDVINLEVGEEYEFFVYFHNNASATLNDSGAGIADDVILKMDIPEKLVKGQAGMAKATISSSNTNPTSVWDTVALKADSTVYLRYVTNSAVMHSLGNVDGTIMDGAAMLSGDGVYLGYYSSLWGVLPGCNEYAGYILFNLKVDQPSFSIDKKASVASMNDYKDNINVAPGDIVDFKITYTNTGTTEQDKVVVFDALPEGMTYIEGTTFLKTTLNEQGTFTSDKLFDGGLVIGDYLPGQTAEITYKVKIEDNTTLFACGDTVIHNNSSAATSTGTEYDQVAVTVQRKCEEAVTELPHTGSGAGIVITVVMTAWAGIGVAYFIAARREELKEEAISEE